MNPQTSAYAKASADTPAAFSYAKASANFDGGQPSPKTKGSDWHLACQSEPWRRLGAI